MNGIQSEPTDVLSGVPHGSVLELLLFLILIGDVDKSVISSFLSSFANDMWIGKGIASKKDAHELQRDLNAVYQWAIDNNMEFNCDKFECVRYGRDKELQNTIPYHSNTGSIIAENETVRDLGVLMSKDGTFKTHIKNLGDTAKKMCG